MNKLHVGISFESFGARDVFIPGVLFLLLAVTLSAQAPKTGIVRRLADVKFPPETVRTACNSSWKMATSTPAPARHYEGGAKCVVPPHYHRGRAVDHRKGICLTGMEGMKDTVLGPGGFAMMPSKAPHWFTCTAKENA